MAKIIEKMDYSDLLREGTPDAIKDTAIEEPKVDKMEEVIHNLNYRESILNRMSKNDKKSYNKGVIKLEITCINCGKVFQVQMTHKQYHNLLLLHKDKINQEKRLANSTEVVSLLSALGVTLPVKEVFFFELCPSCISKWKCQRLGNNATNVEKTSL